jgi:hypothetical protein
MPTIVRSLYLDKPVLVKDEPIAFTRRIPTGAAGVRSRGWNVEVEIRSDLRVTVRILASDRALLTGYYDRDTVAWHEKPSAEAPVTSMDILAADVHAIMRLFHRRFIDPAAWTSVPATLARL